ncbi:RHS repeat-associated core domain-containing protein, partial [Anoxybacillus rupiensis]|nr:RHS repeat-associated core domain-containing protein [Anoxybacillus rupiensis]
WDGEGRLLSVKDVNGNTVASFTYRPDGLRETKTVNGVTYHYHYDGSDLIRVTDDSGQTVWAFTWANGKPNTVTNQNGNTFYYVTNYRGDVVRMVDENGATVANYSYDPWGKVLSVSENAAVTGQPLGYAGYYYDRETKLYYLQARYYDPETARFLSRDAFHGFAEDPQSLNQYAYTKNNPVMYADPSGHIPIIVAEALVGAFINAVGYVAELVAKYGTRNAFKHFSGKKFAVELLKGAAAGAIGGGIVSKLAKAGQLSKVAEKFLAGHLAPAAYLVSNFGDFSGGSFTENQILSMFNNNVGILWATAKPYVKKIYEKYKKWL